MEKCYNSRMKLKNNATKIKNEVVSEDREV